MTTLKQDLDERWRDTSKPRRAVIAVVAVFVVFVMTVGVLAITAGRAHAQCTPNGDTCPTVHTFVKRYHANKIRHDHGLLVKRVWRRPAKARAIFTNKYGHLYDRVSAKRKIALREHADWIANHTSARTAVSKIDGRGATCNMRPMVLNCMAYYEWVWLNSRSHCTGINSYPAAYRANTCVRDDWNVTHDEQWPTWHEVRTGLKLIACTAAVGAAVVVAVGSDGLGAPAVVAMSAGIGCGVAYWEALAD